MKRVYLDQNKWIELLGAHKGRAAQRHLHDLLALMDYGVAHALVSFPLSIAHYMELSHRRDWKSRSELDAFMAAVSRFHSLAPRSDLLAGEIDFALREMFGRPESPRQAQVFGFGAKHATGHNLLLTSDPESSPLSLPPGSGLREIAEAAMLAGPPPDEEANMPGYDPARHREYGRAWAEERERVRQEFRDEGWHREGPSKRLAKVEAFAAHQDALWEGVLRAGLDPRLLTEIGKEGLSRLLDSIPMIFVPSEMVRLKETSDQRPWSSNDLVDVSFLAPAVVYCDVVVTERQWVSFIKRAGFEARYETKAISSLTELAAFLV